MRIGLARLVGGLCRQTSLSPSPPPQHIQEIARRLQGDSSREVRSFVPEWSFAPSGQAAPAPAPSPAPQPTRPSLTKKGSSLGGDGFVFATFSRPPPPAPAPVQEEGRVEVGTNVDRPLGLGLAVGDVRDR